MGVRGLSVTPRIGLALNNGAVFRVLNRPGRLALCCEAGDVLQDVHAPLDILCEST